MLSDSQVRVANFPTSLPFYSFVTMGGESRVHSTSSMQLRMLFDRVAHLTFLKTDFEILAFFENQKQPDKSGFFQSERLDSDKTLSELHIHYKSLLTRVYDHCRVQRILQRFYCCPKNDPYY